MHSISLNVIINITKSVIKTNFKPQKIHNLTTKFYEKFDVPYEFLSDFVMPLKISFITRLI